MPCSNQLSYVDVMRRDDFTVFEGEIICSERVEVWELPYVDKRVNTRKLTHFPPEKNTAPHTRRRLLFAGNDIEHVPAYGLSGRALAIIFPHLELAYLEWSADPEEVAPAEERHPRI